MSIPITDLVALAAAPATGDLLVLVDVSDSTQSPEGSTKSMTVANLFTAPTVTTSLTVTGTLAVSGATTLSSTLLVGASATVSYPGAQLVLNSSSGDGPQMVFEKASVTTVSLFSNAADTLAVLDSSGSVIATLAAGVLTITGLAVGASGITSAGNVLLSTGGLNTSAPTGIGIGYATGAGGAVTQATNRVTGVTIDKLSGAITTSSAALNAEAAAVFTVTNSTVAVGDTVVVSQRSGSNGGDTAVYVSGVAAGSFNITVANNNPSGGTAETGAIIINYAVIKAVSA